tara:strand:- start:100 stop:273 length:174 start_codon:yes stop_codon:yes gene_type:complete
MEEKQDETEKLYLKSLTNKEREAYEIAKSFLESSFDLKKSLGYKAYMKKQSEETKGI